MYFFFIRYFRLTSIGIRFFLVCFIGAHVLEKSTNEKKNNSKYLLSIPIETQLNWRNSDLKITIKMVLYP